MTNAEAIAEAIRKLKDILEEAIETEDAVCYVTSVDEEPLKMAIDALEKQIKKKPIKKTGTELGMYYKNWNYYCCPTCGEPVQVDDDELYSTIYYRACECGQRIKYDWERDEEWKESRNETNR